MKDYIRKINYYETDKMGITHHSNYIRFMEEARLDFLEQIGCGYAQMEKDGVISPVIGVECQYKRPTTFGDEIRIHAEIEEYKRVKLTVAYTIYNNRTEEVVFTGKSMHCFVNAEGRPISLVKQFPSYDAIFRSLSGEEKNS
ncbi:MAG: acyl-CoA thioesterase [Eubacteriales bacterium]